MAALALTLKLFRARLKVKIMAGNKNKKAQTSSIPEAQLRGILANEHTSSWSVKKNSNNCMVVETNDWFYKIRKQNKLEPIYAFQQIVAKAFAKEYALMGLKWKAFEVSGPKGTFSVEKREKLRVLKPGDLPFSEVLKKSNAVKRNVETRLEFPYLTALIRADGQLKHAEKVVLVSSAENNYDDYALSSNGDVVILGTSQFFLGLVNHLGGFERCAVLEPILVSLDCGSFYFDNYETFSSNTFIATLANPEGKFWLFPESVGNIAQVKAHFTKEFENHLAQNLKVLANKEMVKVKTNSDYKSYFEEVQKLKALEN